MTFNVTNTQCINLTEPLILGFIVLKRTPTHGQSSSSYLDFRKNEACPRRGSRHVLNKPELDLDTRKLEGTPTRKIRPTGETRSGSRPGWYMGSWESMRNGIVLNNAPGGDVGFLSNCRLWLFCSQKPATKQQGDSHAPLGLQRPGEWESRLGPREPNLCRRATVPPEQTRARAGN